jgi:hypothetical protein
MDIRAGLGIPSSASGKSSKEVRENDDLYEEESRPIDAMGTILAQGMGRQEVNREEATYRVACVG